MSLSQARRPSGPGPKRIRTFAPWLLVLLFGLSILSAGCQSDSACGLIQPVSAIPVAQCPVTEVTSDSLEQGIDPMTDKPRFGGKSDVYNPPTKPPKTGTQLEIWPLWDHDEPAICQTCVSVCDCKAVGASAPRCGYVLGNREMPELVMPNDRPAACATQKKLPAGMVRCVQGQCVVVPDSAGPNNAK